MPIRLKILNLERSSETESSANLGRNLTAAVGVCPDQQPLLIHRSTDSNLVLDRSVRFTAAASVSIDRSAAA
jgi:hypothetical protein